MQIQGLNPKVDSPPFAATVAAAAPLQHYQVDPVHQPWGLSCVTALRVQHLKWFIFGSFLNKTHCSLVIMDAHCVSCQMLYCSFGPYMRLVTSQNLEGPNLKKLTMLSSPQTLSGCIVASCYICQISSQ